MEAEAAGPGVLEAGDEGPGGPRGHREAIGGATPIRQGEGSVGPAVVGLQHLASLLQQVGRTEQMMLSMPLPKARFELWFRCLQVKRQGMLVLSVTSLGIGAGTALTDESISLND